MRAQQQQAANPGPKVGRVNARGRRGNGGAPKSRAMNGAQNEFKHCVLGGPSVMGGSNGFPDGDPSPAVTLDYKTVLTLKPRTGQTSMAFMVAPNSNGCISIIDGEVSQTVSTIVANSTAIAGFQTSNVTGGDIIGAIPDSRLGSQLVGWGSTTTTSPYGGYRPLVAVANVEYTGSPLYASGAVSVTNYAVKLVRAGTSPYTHDTSLSSTATKVETRQADTAIGVTLPNTVVMPARESFTARVLVPPGAYEPLENRLYDSGNSSAGAQSAFGFATTRASGGSFPGPAWYPTGTAKVIRYTGLDASASITVTMRYCVQLALSADSELSALARPSPPKDVKVISWYEGLTSRLPTIETIARVSRVVMPMLIGRSNDYPSLRDEM